MIATPLRWLVMAGVAACGFFTITSDSMNTRAFAFVMSVMLWQAHYIIMMYEADMIRSAGVKKEEATPVPPLKESVHSGDVMEI